MDLLIKKVTKKYDDKIVLNDLSLNIKDKKVIAFIGASGCGKSTLLRLISGIEQANVGNILLNDNEITAQNKKEFQKQIGYVFQNHNLFPHLTLKQNITLILEKTRGFSKEDAEARAVQMLTKVKLFDQKDKKPNTVSGGQAQRASIARALSTDASFLFLDEPTAALDPILAYEVIETIKGLKNSGADIFLVTHELNLVKEIADYFVFMDDGRIIEQNEIEGLNTPKTDLLKEFVKKVK